MALVMVFALQHVQMAVKASVKVVKEVVKMDAQVGVPESVQVHVAMVVDKDVLNLVLQNVL